MTQLEIRGLTVAFGAQPALDAVDWAVQRGEFWGIVGPNGSGKTTLLRAALGLLPVARGAVRWFDTPLADFHDWRRLGYLPQFTALPLARFPATAREVVASGRLAGQRFPRRMRRPDQAAVEDLLRQLDATDLADRRIGELSGGQRQRILLARALVNHPDVLLLDEPTVALDPDSRAAFYRLLRELNAARGVTVLLVTHDSATVGAYASRLLYLDGRVVFQGPFDAFCRSPDMEARFGAYAQHLMCHQHGARPDPTPPGGAP